MSNLIFAGQITKAEALEELSKPPYDLNMQKMDFEYVGKKLGFTIEEFDQILSLPNQSHLNYETDLEQRKLYFNMMKNLKPLTSILKGIK